MALGREVHLAGERLDQAGEQAGAVSHLVGGGGGGRHRSVPPGSVVVAWDPTSRGAVRPTAVGPPRRATCALLGVAVVAVSTSAPLIARRRRARAGHRVLAQRAQPAGARRCGSSPAATSGPGWRARSARDRRLSRLAGVFLAAHFATWIPSLSFTSVASSVALVATQPVWAALIARHRGEHIAPADLDRASAWRWPARSCSPAWTCRSPARALFGDLLALLGGMLAAAYVTVGAEVRQRVSTVSYALACYATAGRRCSSGSAW